MGRRLGAPFAPDRVEETPMPNNDLDDNVDPLADDTDVVDEADEDDEFEGDDEEDEDEADVEGESDFEAHAGLTHEVGSEGGSPGEEMEIFRSGRNDARGSEATETATGRGRLRDVERREEDDRLI
jgi:hypothetical protein